MKMKIHDKKICIALFLTEEYLKKHKILRQRILPEHHFLKVNLIEIHQHHFKFINTY